MIDLISPPDNNQKDKIKNDSNRLPSEPEQLVYKIPPPEKPVTEELFTKFPDVQREFAQVLSAQEMKTLAITEHHVGSVVLTDPPVYTAILGLKVERNGKSISAQTAYEYRGDFSSPTEMTELSTLQTNQETDTPDEILKSIRKGDHEERQHAALLQLALQVHENVSEAATLTKIERRMEETSSSTDRAPKLGQAVDSATKQNTQPITFDKLGDEHGKIDVSAMVYPGVEIQQGAHKYRIGTIETMPGIRAFILEMNDRKYRISGNLNGASSSEFDDKIFQEYLTRLNVQKKDGSIQVMMDKIAYRASIDDSEIQKVIDTIELSQKTNQDDHLSVPLKIKIRLNNPIPLLNKITDLFGKDISITVNINRADADQYVSTAASSHSEAVRPSPEQSPVQTQKPPKEQTTETTVATPSLKQSPVQTEQPDLPELISQKPAKEKTTETTETESKRKRALQKEKTAIEVRIADLQAGLKQHESNSYMLQNTLKETANHIHAEPMYGDSQEEKSRILSTIKQAKEEIARLKSEGIHEDAQIQKLTIQLEQADNELNEIEAELAKITTRESQDALDKSISSSISIPEGLDPEEKQESIILELKRQKSQYILLRDELVDKRNTLDRQINTAGTRNSEKPKLQRQVRDLNARINNINTQIEVLDLKIGNEGGKLADLVDERLEKESRGGGKRKHDGAPDRMEGSDIPPPRASTRPGPEFPLAPPPTE